MGYDGEVMSGAWTVLALGMLETGHGKWDVRAWAVAFLVAAGVALWIRALGRKDSGGKGEAKMPFLSGNAVESGEEARVGASHMYWGFTEALKGYYRRVRGAHAGRLTDYVLWFVAVVALWLLLGKGA